ncbi:(-)-isopiperitenone reductase-like [Salvia hispanica]|uniref:(-)-isopiperitenone reductase-like n=1 Tax=Salvia hispanica TaxID=49212 RepID=UPI002009A438|nr:(-)-isopiperitenone reductase-like [Salvia hispanica]
MADAGVRYALVTGGNKGIGLEICKQLASKGIKVILTSRDEKRGLEALQILNHSGLSHHVDFLQLNVVDAASIAAAVQFFTTKYGRLDILVNNAGVLGLEGDVSIPQEVVEATVVAVVANSEVETPPLQLKTKGTTIQTYEAGEKCIHTNYYGVKRVTEAFIPLLQLSDSPTIVNVSSMGGHLTHLRNERAKAVLSNEAGLTEESVDGVVQEFLIDFKEGRLEKNKWLNHATAYQVSKAALNAYTKVLAKRHTDFIINSLCPGFARTDMNGNLGAISAEEAAQKVVRVALLPRGGPSGAFFYDKDAYGVAT